MANFISSDGIVNLLIIEAVLRDKDYSITMFNNTYKDYPSNILNISVSNKNRFRTNEDQTKLIEPTRL